MDDANEVEVEVAQDIRRPALCVWLGSLAVPKSYTSGSLPSGALNRKLAPQPENTYWRLHDVLRRPFLT
jgi:hypothetical protein